jgi:hypothetical protein
VDELDGPDEAGEGECCGGVDGKERAHGQVGEGS